MVACEKPRSLLSGCFGQGRLGASNTVASRLFQFLSSLQKVLVNCSADKFGNRSARLVGQFHQPLELFFLQEEGCPLHDHIVSYRHTCVHRPEVPKDVEQ